MVPKSTNAHECIKVAYVAMFISTGLYPNLDL